MAVAMPDRAALAQSALTEYARRKLAWERMRDDAAGETDAARIVTRANADLILWREIVEWLELGNIPADTRACARSARRTLDAMRASTKASEAAIGAMHRLTRTLEGDAILRHGSSAIACAMRAPAETGAAA
jgi:hypothetical protein